MKTISGKTGRKVGLWGAMASCLALGAAAWSLNGLTPIKDAQNYGCVDSCFINFRVCLMAGTAQSVCVNQYMTCVTNCTVGGTQMSTITGGVN